MAGLRSWPSARVRRRLRLFLRADDGSTAVEFAFVIFPFFFMIFAILELALIFTVNSVLENATIETGRLVRTGQASATNMGAAEFKNRLCARMSVFAAQCAQRATIDVREIPQFADAPTTGADDGGFVPTYSNGQPGSLIVVRVWYQHPLITAFLAQGLSRRPDGTTLLMATTAFRNEPP